MIAQVALLAWIAGLGAGGVAAAVAIGAIGAATLMPAALRRAPEATVMLAAGGLGMTTGWWADLDFTTASAVAAHAHEPLDLVWCRGPAALAAFPDLGHISWMNLGMLALGMPAVTAARRRTGRGDAHGIAALFACAAAMSIGMSAGARGAAALAPALGASGVVVADWTLMSVGMLAGMAAVKGVHRWLARVAGSAARPRDQRIEDRSSQISAGFQIPRPHRDGCSRPRSLDRPQAAMASSGMANEPLRFEDEPARDDLEFLESQINDFNFEITGYRDGRYLTVFVRDAGGAIRAGLSGHTWGGCAEVKFLWVRESERRSGLGTRLLAAAEAEARARGCKQIVLSTHSFQAPRFYAKHGYTVAGEFPGYPIGHGQIFLRKSLL